MKRAIWFVAVSFLLGPSLSASTSSDIDYFVKGFNAERLNGLWPSIDLPPDASPAKVVEVLAQIESKDEQFRGYRIMETRKINDPKSQINGDIVVLIASDRGSKTIILLQAPGVSPGMSVHNVGRNHLGWMTPFFYLTTVP